MKTLYVLPCVIDQDTIALQHLPASINHLIEQIDCFVVERTRSARRFIRKVSKNKDLDATIFFELDKHEGYKNEALKEFLQKNKHQHIGLLSESGTASIADPGFHAVEIAQKLNFTVHPIAGPSSITMALSASGLNGQNFAFIGYLPIEKTERKKRILFLQQLCIEQTQIFIESPHRNDKLFKDLLLTLKNEIKLCIAKKITSEEEYIKTKSIQEWKESNLTIEKVPTIFLIGSS